MHAGGMFAHLTPSVTVARASEAHNAVDYRRLARAVAAGHWVCVAPGAFVPADEWQQLMPIERHRVRVDEAIRRLHTPSVVSHFAAAAQWDIDVLGKWPQQIDISRPGLSGGKPSGMLRRHAIGSHSIETMAWGGHQITTPAQTVLDLARALAHVPAVASIDQAVWTDRPGGALTTQAEIADLASRQSDRRGSTRARQSIAASECLAANVRESQARVVIAALGFPRMRLQERRILATGRLVYGDLYMPEVDHWIEVDGRGKYLSPTFARGRTTAQIVLDEKARENEIRREVRGFSRLDALDADDPRRVYDILTADGLHSSRRRP